jgi:hypothetical protein
MTARESPWPRGAVGSGPSGTAANRLTVAGGLILNREPPGWSATMGWRGLALAQAAQASHRWVADTKKRRPASRLSVPLTGTVSALSGLLGLMVTALLTSPLKPTRPCSGLS